MQATQYGTRFTIRMALFELFGKKPATSSNDLRYTQNLKGVKEERGYTGMVGMLPRFKVSFQRGQDHQQAIQLVQMRPPGKV